MNSNLKIMQFRYVNDNDNGANNYPSGLESSNFSTNTTENFLTKYDIKNITQLGIQTLPGVRFTINNSPGNYITVGQTGIYEIELTDDVMITNLQFDEESLKMINDNNSAFLIIDLVYQTVSSSYSSKGGV